VQRNVGRSKSVKRVLDLLRDERGALILEYTILIGVVAISSSIAFVGMGVALVKNFEFVRGLLLTPFP
jgi:Flp pilus assembly pilin Flp